MIVYSDRTLQLDYVPEDNLLLTSLQEVRVYETKEVRLAFLSIVACVKEYNISRLLLDFTRNTYDLAETEYKATMAQLTVGLLQTPLEKVACLTTPDAIREHKIETTLGAITDTVHVPIEVQMFTTKKEAVHWLVG
jgi:hypothetical protein